MFSTNYSVCLLLTALFIYCPVSSRYRCPSFGLSNVRIRSVIHLDQGMFGPLHSCLLIGKRLPRLKKRSEPQLQADAIDCFEGGQSGQSKEVKEKNDRRKLGKKSNRSTRVSDFLPPPTILRYLPLSFSFPISITC